MIVQSINGARAATARQVPSTRPPQRHHLVILASE